MPNSDWIVASKYQADPSVAGAEAQWRSSPKLEKYFMSDDLEKTKLRKMVRAGIPDLLRGEVYARMLKLDKLNEYEKNYEIALSRTHGTQIPTTPLPPTFGGRSYRHGIALNAKGSTIAEHVLCILAHDFPNLEYCPFVPACVTLLAHHMRNEDELLGAAVSIIKRSMAQPQVISSSNLSKSSSVAVGEWAFFPTYRKGAKFMFRAFGNLLHRTNRKLHYHITELHASSPDPVWASWLTSLFIDAFPQPALWRMLDCFILEGYKALFRFGVGMLLANRDEVMQQTDLAGVKALLTPENPVFKTLVPLCKAADGVNAARAEVRKLVEHHQTLAAISRSDDIHEAQYRFQRGLPKIVGGLSDTGTGSSILNDEHWIALWSWIPPSKRVEGLELLFTTKEHGTHVNNLFRRTQDRAPLILLVETTEGAVFGAFLSHAWPGEGERTGEWYGNGETFLFTLEPYAKLYPWVGRTHTIIETESPDGDLSESAASPSSIYTTDYVRDRASMFIMIAKKQIYIGAGGSSTGLFLNETLTAGDTGPCQTFENAPLTGSKEKQFECHVVEVFAFS
ncbi:hypothetical protein SpCBS45565_g02033 [Spizellomyces sp. 'palustris']|nr:hypothetical protein SpCBS45565_g02033 [Spizellomyces sp. 'palustris']